MLPFKVCSPDGSGSNGEHASSFQYRFRDYSHVTRKPETDAQPWFAYLSEVCFPKSAMQKAMRRRLDSLPKTEASFVEPMECLSVSKLPGGNQWVWEVKLDGYRALAVKAGTGVSLFSRRRKSLNRQFPYIVEALGTLPEGTVLDGKLVALDDSGRPDFNLLQHFRAEASRIHYYIFDLLCWKGRDLTRLPLVERDLERRMAGA